jgi:hypothetical protein
MKDLEEIVTREVKPNDVIIKAMLHNIKIIDTKMPFAHLDKQS